MRSVRTTPASNTPMISSANGERDAIMSVAFEDIFVTKSEGSVGINFSAWGKARSPYAEHRTPEGLQ